MARPRPSGSRTHLGPVPDLRPLPGNAEIADRLEDVAELLAVQDASHFRIRAWQRGAEAARAFPGSLAAHAERVGAKGLVPLEHIGERLAAAIVEIVNTGGLAYLERLRGETGVECLLQTLPGIGPRLAARVHERLGIETLEELELAAHDGRLAAVPGFGAARTRLVRDLLAERLRRQARERSDRRQAPAGPEPPVALLLALDREYRRGADAGTLPRIAPRRFNPGREAWLPVLHADRDGWHFTLLFSNTARAHELGRADDWVVIFCEQDGIERQCTVVTERRGPLEGFRVVRGREAECARHYREGAA